VDYLCSDGVLGDEREKLCL